MIPSTPSALAIRISSGSVTVETNTRRPVLLSAPRRPHSLVVRPTMTSCRAPTAVARPSEMKLHHMGVFDRAFDAGQGGFGSAPAGSSVSDPQ